MSKVTAFEFFDFIYYLSGPFDYQHHANGMAISVYGVIMGNITVSDRDEASFFLLTQC
jgi:hypothetical protein